MAVLIEFSNVIFLKSAVESCFPGGLDAFASLNPSNLTEDDHLLRVGFMATSYSFDFIDEVMKKGWCNNGLEIEQCIAVIEIRDEVPCPPWLTLGPVNDHYACWATGYPVGELALPELGFMQFYPYPLYQSLSEVVKRCGAEIQEVTKDAGWDGIDSTLRCFRGEAEFLINVCFQSQDPSSEVGLFGIRQLSRRKHFRVDVSLIHDIEALLIQSGASRELPS